MTPDPAVPPREPLHNPGVASFSSLWLSLRAVSQSFVHLFLLEARQAGISAVMMLAFGLAAMILLVTGWLAIVACIIIALVEHDVVGWATALIIAAVLSFAGAGILGYLIIKFSKDLMFTATRRQLLGRDPSLPSNPSEHGKTG